MCSLEEAWGKDYLVRYQEQNEAMSKRPEAVTPQNITGTSMSHLNTSDPNGAPFPMGDSNDTYFSQSGLRVDYMDTPEGLMYPGTKLPMDNKKAVRGNTRRMESQSCKNAELCKPKAYSSIYMDPAPMGVNACRANLYSLDGKEEKDLSPVPTLNTSSQIAATRPTESFQSSSSSEDPDYSDILAMLQTINNKLDSLEATVVANNTRNIHDIILYILIGMIISFILYMILTSRSH